MPVGYLLNSAQQWFINHGIILAILLVIALLIPRIGRFTKRIFTRRLDTIDPGNKSRLALVGAGVYIAQLVSYFVLTVLALQEFGFSPTGAAIPATVISAALGLGAQSIIADFLAGFFIITEKQFGVGDWVQFIGPNIDVEGDVIQMTMRATTVRTLNGETVIVPNSTARVCINHSNFWARAVVVIPIPLLGSQSIHEAIARSEKATRRALVSQELEGDVTGDLDVHPAVEIQKPTTVGMPWMVDMRFVVQVNPARQWAVERAIRTSILEEFWQEYGSATTVSGAVRETLEAEPTVAMRPYPSPPLVDVAVAPPQAGTAAVDSTTARTSADHEHTPTAPQPAVTRDVARQASAPSRSDLSVEQPAHSPHESAEEDDTELFRQVAYTGFWGKITSLGGRVRPSTSALFILLFGLFLLKAWTVDADPESPATTSSEQVHYHEPAPVPTTTENTVTQPSTTETSTTVGTTDNTEPESEPSETLTPTEEPTSNTSPQDQPSQRSQPQQSSQPEPEVTNTPEQQQDQSNPDPNAESQSTGEQ